MKNILKSIAIATFGFVPRYFDQLAAQNKISFMTDTALMEQINRDAEDGRINTDYSREYDSRRGQAARLRA